MLPNQDLTPPCYQQSGKSEPYLPNDPTGLSRSTKPTSTISAESPSLVGMWLSSRELNTGKQNLPIRDRGDHVGNKHVRAPDCFLHPISKEQTPSLAT